jgi:hypothetical protein
MWPMRISSHVARIPNAADLRISTVVAGFSRDYMIFAGEVPTNPCCPALINLHEIDA